VSCCPFPQFYDPKPYDGPDGPAIRCMSHLCPAIEDCPGVEPPGEETPLDKMHHEVQGCLSMLADCNARIGELEMVLARLFRNVASAARDEEP
jgi:hypothetical protein